MAKSSGHPSHLAVDDVVALVRRAEFRAAARAIDDAEHARAASPALFAIRTRIALKSDPAFALAYAERHARAVRDEQRAELLLLQGVAYARLGDDAAARARFDLVDGELDDASPLRYELAYQRAALLWMRRKLVAARRAVQAIPRDACGELAVEVRVLEGAIEAANGDVLAQSGILLDTLRTIEASGDPNVYHLAIVASYIAYLARELPNASLRDAAYATIDRIPWTADLDDLQFSMRRAVAWRRALDGDEFTAFRELKRSAESAPTPAHRVVATCDRASLALALGEPRWAAQETRDASDAADRIDWRTVAGEERFGLCLLAELLAPRDAALALSYLARYRADGPRFARTLSSADDVRVGALEAYSFGVVRFAAGDVDEARRLLRESFEAYRTLGYRWRAARAALALAQADDGPTWREQAANSLAEYPRSFLAASLGGAARAPSPSRTFAEAERLTPAQRTIFDLVVQGLPTSEIARAVGRSEFTVKNHLKAIFKTCGVRSRAALIAKVNSSS